MPSEFGGEVGVVCLLPFGVCTLWCVPSDYLTYVPGKEFIAWAGTLRCCTKKGDGHFYGMKIAHHEALFGVVCLVGDNRVAACMRRTAAEIRSDPKERLGPETAPIRKGRWIR
ncbi:hypothetical protein F4861DRAFT_321250 [Xylaria intraflava]|nr:hypothetical protein F4861DRAFT_321250 [Xylaria intraflava]